MDAVTRTVQATLRPQLEAFYYRIGVEILTGEHGTLAAVLAPETGVPPFLSDGITVRLGLEASKLHRPGLMALSGFRFGEAHAGRDISPLLLPAVCHDRGIATSPPL
jgi:hypothetical protein